MELKGKIAADLKEAMKAGDAFRVGVLRLLTAAIHNKEIESRAKTGSEVLTQEQALQVVSTEAKKRKEAILIFKSGKRDDLADKESRELGLINAYLPKQMDSVETERAVREILAREKVVEFGQAMKIVMGELRGKADAKLIGEIVAKAVGKS